MCKLEEETFFAHCYYLVMLVLIETYHSTLLYQVCVQGDSAYAIYTSKYKLFVIFILLNLSIHQCAKFGFRDLCSICDLL